MPAPPFLKITKTIRVSHWKAWTAIAITCLIFVWGPILVVVRFLRSSSSLYGPITDNLLRDVSKAYPSPKPFRSSWLEHPVLRSGLSHYRDLTSSEQTDMEVFLILFPWRGFLAIAIKLICYLFLTGDFIMDNRVMEVRLKRVRYAIFFIFCACYSFLMVLALDGAINLNHRLTKDIGRWLESSVVHVGPEEMHMEILETKTRHPLTSGRFKPYFYYEKFRYVGEDVQFTCEYKVLGEMGVEPIFASSWWSKNGKPVETSDRMSINVTLYPEDELSILDLRWFTVRNTLTINMIETDHYGKYSCTYHDPLPLTTVVEPVFENVQRVKIKKTETPPTSPDQQSDPKPQDLSEITKTYDTSLDLLRVLKGFAEFALKPSAVDQQDFHVKVNTGSILFTEFCYISQADMSDLSVDHSFSELSSSDCCSPMAKLYWILFRGGLFVNLPISRAVWFNGTVDILHFAKWVCVCKDTFKQKSGVIYRRIFNSTLNAYETVEIRHPVSIVLNPASNKSAPFVDTLAFCDGTESFLCDFLDLIFENQFYTVYGIDITILSLGLVYIFLIYMFHFRSKMHISIPFRNICLHIFLNRSIPFETVHGPQINQLQTDHSGAFENNGPQNGNGEGNDIYITYCQDNPFDCAVAQHFKKILAQRELNLFDPYFDILPGHPMLTESHAAIHRSARFVIFASDAFKEDLSKQLEFDAINDTIKSQETKAKSRLLIVRLGHCDIDGLHRVPCITIPNTDRERFRLDEFNIYRFKEWEDATRPMGKRNSSNNSFWKQLNLFGLNWKSITFSFVLVFLARYSFLFAYDEELCMSSETLLNTYTSID